MEDFSKLLEEAKSRYPIGTEIVPINIALMQGDRKTVTVTSTSISICEYMRYPSI